MNLRFVKSSNIELVGYDDEKSLLRIVFKTGVIYDYHKVPKAIFTAFLAATSKGQFFHKYIKPKFIATRSN